MSNIDLEIDKVRDICQQWQIDKLALFGSVLREDFNLDGDINKWL